jgi:hypothetical protein
MIKSPVREIIAAIDAASALWRDAAYERRLRTREAVGARTGYSLASVDYALDRIFDAVRREAIEAVIADELGSLDALDDFVARDKRPRARALSIGSVCIVSSRTTIGVAIVPAIFALCAKCKTLVKDRDDHFVAAFFATVAEQLPALRGNASAATWSGEGDATDLSSYAAVVALGDDATLAKIAATLGSGVRFIAYGSKASAGYVTREALRDEDAARDIARGAALDLTLYETEGCLSLHALFVESGGAVGAVRFAELLEEAMRAAVREFVPAPDAQTSSRRAMARELAAFRQESGALCADPAAPYLVVLDPPYDEPPLFLARAIGVRRVDGPARAAEYLERHGITLEALAVAGERGDVVDLALRVKAARVAPFGSLQSPPLGAFHGGRPRIAEFVRWIGDET